MVRCAQTMPPVPSKARGAEADAGSTKRRRESLVLAAAAILLITMGARQTLGLFVAPLNRSTGAGIVAISFAMAVGQFVWGLAQPVFGAIAERYGSQVVLLVGAVVLALGAILTTVVSTSLGLILSIGVLFAAGAAGGSFSVLIGATARRLAPEQRAFASGVINAGGSLGQFLLAPISQLIIAAFGWAAAMYALAVAALATIPLGRRLTRVSDRPAAATIQDTVTVAAGESVPTLWQQLREAS